MKWRIKGFKGQHDEDGATIVNEYDSFVASTYGGLYQGATPAMWEEYHRTARLVEKAPELLELARNIAMLDGRWDSSYTFQAQKLVRYINAGS